jgi:valyl-tRNA synthetase
VRDIEGKKMSKSLGNIIDPLEIIAKYGADALRFSLISITASGQDVYLSEQKFELGRNFANKLWNASRFSLMNLDLNLVNIDLCVFFKKEKLGLPERWILSRFYSMLARLNKAMDNFRFSQAANILYEFIWHEFCDWYLELTKPNLVYPALARKGGVQSPEFKAQRDTQVVLYKVLEKTLRCLYPFMPFITEEIWQKLQPEPQTANNRKPRSIMTQPWPHIQKLMIDQDIESKMRLAIDAITVIRNLKSGVKLPQSQNVKVTILAKDKEVIAALEETSQAISYLAKLENLRIRSERPREIKSISALSGKTQVLLELEGVIDIEKEIEKLAKEIGAITADLKSKEARLKNKEFLKKAPKEVIEREKELVTLNKENLAASNRILDELKK